MKELEHIETCAKCGIVQSFQNDTNGECVMVWVEEIEICTAVNKEKKAQQYLLGTALYMRGKKGLTDVNVYIHAHMANEFSIRFIWNTDSFKYPGSEEGINLREILKQFGLVTYSVWIEKEWMKKQSNLNRQKKVRH
jgi:hypothetical protein